MFLPLYLMAKKKSFWISGQRWLTSGFDRDIFFNKQDAQDVLLTPDKANIPVIGKRKRRRYRGHRAGMPREDPLRVRKLPLPSILLANVQSLDNKLDEVRSRISYQQDIKNCNILCFTESWLNDDIENIQLVGYMLHRLNRTAEMHSRWLPHEAGWENVKSVQSWQRVAALKNLKYKVYLGLFNTFWLLHNSICVSS